MFDNGHNVSIRPFTGEIFSLKELTPPGQKHKEKQSNNHIEKANSSALLKDTYVHSDDIDINDKRASAQAALRYVQSELLTSDDNQSSLDMILLHPLLYTNLSKISQEEKSLENFQLFSVLILIHRITMISLHRIT